MRRIFLSHSFAEYDRVFLTHVESLIRSHGLAATNGRILAGGPLTPEIKKSIDEADALVALFTLRESELQKELKQRSHPWVHAEFGYARLQARVPVIGLYETDVEVDPTDAGNERIDYDRTAPLECFLRLSSTIGEWKRRSGRLFKIQVLPDNLARLLGSNVDRVTCEFRVQRDNTDSQWQDAKMRREVAGVFVYIRVPDDADMVQLRTNGPVASESDYTPLWMPVHLEPRN